MKCDNCKEREAEWIATDLKPGSTMSRLDVVHPTINLCIHCLKEFKEQGSIPETGEIPIIEG